MSSPESAFDASPGAVLFTCNFNRVRSPMAEALMKLAYGTAIFVDSCGLKADPGEIGMDPFAAVVLQELGIDPASHRPKTFDMLEDDSFAVITGTRPRCGSTSQNGQKLTFEVKIAGATISAKYHYFERMPSFRELMK